jgi:hypothetical protein
MADRLGQIEVPPLRRVERLHDAPDPGRRVGDARHLGDRPRHRILRNVTE